MINDRRVIQDYKNMLKIIENYFENPNDKMIQFKLIHNKIIKKYNNKMTDRFLRKDVKIIKDLIHKTKISEKSEKIANTPQYYKYDLIPQGLYHDRIDDPFDLYCLDCTEHGFCLHHKRKYSGKNYKFHYHCKYNNKYNNKFFSNKFVCFKCKHIIKRYNSEKSKVDDSKTTFDIYKNWPKCSKCSNHMTCVDVAFQPPPKKDIKHWEKLDKEWSNDSRITYEEWIKNFTN